MAQIVDVARIDAVPGAIVVNVLENSDPGKSRQFLRMRASLRSLTVLRWRTPLFARESSSICPRLMRTWRVLSVVSPKLSFCRAYSGLPTRAKVRSIKRITAANTFSRGKPGRARSIQPGGEPPAGSAQKPTYARTWFHRERFANGHGSDTACDFARRDRSPGYGRWHEGKSRRRSTKAELRSP
jgi:hypothetical protein